METVIGIINGPNLNLTGSRETGLYGLESFEELMDDLARKYPQVHFHYFQSNIEGEIIDKIQDWGIKQQGLVINAGAYTHTSVAIGDAVKAVPAPIIEVHLSNIFSRESFRHHSYISPNARGVICGFGMDSYRLAVGWLLKQ